jgi:hypothetical protein
MRNYLLLGCSLLLMFYSCEEENDPKNLSNKIEVSDLVVTDISYKTAKLSSKIPNTYNVEIEEFGHCWSLDSIPDINDSITVYNFFSNELFTSELNRLKHNSTYFFRAYCEFDDLVIYSPPVSFKTLEIKLPSVQINGYSSLGAKSVVFGAQVSDFDIITTDSCGFCWSTASNPTIDNENIVGYLTDELDDYNLFNGKIENLEINTKYYIRAYAANEVGISYGSEVEFTTKDGVIDITTSELKEITSLSAKSGGVIVDDENLEITEKGVCWNTTGNPIISDQKTSDGEGISDFVSNISDLNISTTYYVKAYVVNQVGVSYGNELEFTTNDGTPIIYISQVLDITASTANINVQVLDSGSLEIIEKGVCWNTNGDPSLNDSVVNVESLLEQLVHIENLMSNTTYYVKAFLKNELGVIFSSEYSFTTLDKVSSVVLSGYWNLTYNSVNIGSLVTDFDGIETDSSGFCWNKTGSPTVNDENVLGYIEEELSDYKIVNGFLGNLDIDTEYFICAYAANEAGIVYSNEVGITTNDGTPIIYISQVLDITASTANINVQLPDSGLLEIIEKGVCWNTTGDPSLNDSIVSVESFLEQLVHIENLISNTMYYIKAYVKNESGVTFSSEYSFTTL